MSRFIDDTAVTRSEEGRYRATIDRGWWIERGPNGGYLAAIVARAALAEVGDSARRLRTLTLHYLRPPVEGPCEVAVTIERAGRGVTTVSARLQQEGHDCVLALAAIGADREGPSLHAHPAPVVPPPDEVPPRPELASGEHRIPIHGRYDVRHALGPLPFSGGDEAITGGWIRTADHDAVDDVLLVALTDAWIPAVFSSLDLPVGVPTVELTVHLHGRPAPGAQWSLVRFTTREAVAGYLEETGEVWSQDGRLLAESRQLAVLLV